MNEENNVLKISTDTDQTIDKLKTFVPKSKQKKAIFILADQIIYSNAEYKGYQYKTLLLIMNSLQLIIQEQMKSDTFSQLSLFGNGDFGDNVVVKIKAKDIASTRSQYKVLKDQLIEMQSTLIVLEYTENKGKGSKETQQIRIEQFFALVYPKDLSKDCEIKFIFQHYIAKLLVTIPKKTDVLSLDSKVTPTYDAKIDPSVFLIKKSLSAMSLAVLLMSSWPNKRTVSYSFKNLKDFVREDNPNTYTTFEEYSTFVLKRASSILKKTQGFPFYFSFTKEKKGKEMEDQIFHFMLIPKVVEIADAGVTIQGD